MSRFAEPMARLIDELKKLPGVGSKSAQRLAFHILRSSDEDAEALAAAVRDVKANLRLCSVCNNITDVDPCVYCTSPTRNQRLVCVVEEPTNIAAIDKTKHFNGVFHVLHGAISPLHGVGPEQLRISNLISRVDAGSVDEVILAIPVAPNIAPRDVILRELAPMVASMGAERSQPCSWIK